MKCLKCSNTAKIPYPNGNLCEKCFIDVLTARIKRDTKLNNIFKKGEKVLVFGRLAEVFLKKAMPDLPLKITLTNKKYDRIKDLSRYDKIVVPFTADDEAELFYSEITKKKVNLKENKKIVKLFRTVLDDELNKAAKILKVKINNKNNINNKNKINKNRELKKIKRKFPHSIFGLRKSADEFRKAIK